MTTTTSRRRQHVGLLHRYLRCPRCGQHIHPAASTPSGWQPHPQLAGRPCPQPHPPAPADHLDALLDAVYQLITTHMIDSQTAYPTLDGPTPGLGDLLPLLPVDLLQRLLHAYRLDIGYDRHRRHALLHVATPAAGTRRRYRTHRITLGEPQYVELSEADRRNAVAALADILIAWQQRQTNSPPAPTAP